MKKFLLISLFTALTISFFAQITREEADFIVLKYFQNEVSTPYILYINANEPNEDSFVIITSNDEIDKANGKCCKTVNKLLFEY